MYIVQWCDHEGNQQKRSVKTMRDAKREARYLQEKYGEEAVQIVPEKSGKPEK